MIAPADFTERLVERGFRLQTGVPCSMLAPLIDAAEDSQRLRYVGAANEGDAVAIAAGAELTGNPSCVVLQNSGLGNAVNPLTSLAQTFEIPMLLIVGERGGPDHPPDEPQHALMGSITRGMLELMQIPWELLPADETELDATLDRAQARLREQRRPYALVVPRKCVAPHETRAAHAARPPEARDFAAPAAEERGRRPELLEALRSAARPEDVLIATTGYTGRELFGCGDRANQLYMVGSMGCAPSLGLGIALCQPERRVLVLDGDGASLMRLGALACIGYERPPNLFHVLFDNGMHESTGGQPTVSASIDFPALAAACGYARVGRETTPAGVTRWMRERADGLTFLHVPVGPRSAGSPPRPDVGPHEIAQRLRAHLRGTT